MRVGDIAFHQRLVVFVLLGRCLNVDLLVHGIPLGIGQESAQIALLELKVGHSQSGPGREVAEELGQFGLSRSLSAEADGIEVYYVEDIAHVELVEVYAQRVGVLVGGYSVNDEVLLLVGNAEVVHQQPLVAVEYVAGLHLPGLATKDEQRRQHAHVGFRFPLLVGV